MAAERRYASPKAFRRALTDRLKTLAAESRWELPQLQRQIAYDRLLERLYLIDFNSDLCKAAQKMGLEALTE